MEYVKSAGQEHDDVDQDAIKATFIMNFQNILMMIIVSVVWLTD